MTLLFVDHLTVIDCSLLDVDRGLVGETWIVDIQLEGKLNNQGMIFDFGPLKALIKKIINSTIDHCLLIPMHAAKLNIDESDHLCSVEFHTQAGKQIHFEGPKQAIAKIDAASITTESVATTIIQQIKPQLPPNVTGYTVQLRPENIEGPFYHYSHGLKKHQGNCQRIAHGHRSKIIIRKNGARAPELEKCWAERWRDIYIGNREDLERSSEINGISYSHFAYKAPEGEFKLSLATENCYLIDSESTVENIAEHIKNDLLQTDNNSIFEIIAFEGFNKGAISR